MLTRKRGGFSRGDFGLCIIRFLDSSWIRFFRKRARKGFTFIELLVVIGIVGTLLVLTIPAFSNMLEKNRITRAMAEIALISQKIEDHMDEKGTLPDFLSDLDAVYPIDPWGNPYAYLKIFGKTKGEVAGRWRMDRFLVPLNTDFDLYSKGKDGESASPLTSKLSHDDIIRANNGDYIGIAIKY